MEVMNQLGEKIDALKSRFSNMRFLSLILALFAFSLPANAQLFGAKEINERIDKLESYTRKLANQTNQIAEVINNQKEPDLSPIEIRLGSIEASLQDLTGQYETLQFEIQQIKETANKENEASEEAVFNQEYSNKIADLVSRLERLEASNNISPIEAVSDEKIIPNIDIPEDPNLLYDMAYRAYQNLNYSDAEYLFGYFSENHKDHLLLANSYFWLGDIYLKKNNPEEAAIQFLQGYSANTEGNKAPDNLIKLAEALNKQGKLDEACTTLDKLSQDFPNAEQRIISKRDAMLESCK